MSTLAITRVGPDWLVTCADCGAERIFTRHPAADRWAAKHATDHHAKETPMIPDTLSNQIVNLLDQDDLDERVSNLNALRELIAAHSPFSDEPVDLITWVKADDVHANDYNPNVVAPPEMELLRVSIASDGYTQPIVTMPAEHGREVIDGFHRNRVGKECPDVQKRVHGYLPVVTIRTDRRDKGDRIAATIRHNRARGKHLIEAMSDIVIELKKRNWSDERIGRELGMDPDEVLRLCQITGLAELFADQGFSLSWDIEAEALEERAALHALDEHDTDANPTEEALF